MQALKIHIVQTSQVFKTCEVLLKHYSYPCLHNILVVIYRL